MKITKKDIIALVIGAVIVIGSVLIIMRLLNPTAGKQATVSESDAIPAVPDAVDENAYKNLEGLSDYGQPPLENIGKKDLFAGF